MSLRREHPGAIPRIHEVRSGSHEKTRALVGHRGEPRSGARQRPYVIAMPMLDVIGFEALLDHVAALEPEPATIDAGRRRLQIDRVPPGMRSREVNFLGGRWRAPEGPIALAALSGAPILPVFTHRLGFLEYEAVVAPPIRLARRATEEEREAAAAEMIGAMERFIRAHPTQWFHFAGDGPVAPAEGGTS